MIYFPTPNNSGRGVCSSSGGQRLSRSQRKHWSSSNSRVRSFSICIKDEFSVSSDKIGITDEEAMIQKILDE